ncbi:MAG TPA: AraC family transcriptional regulator, partial [Chloroflexota bacterium]|nr:AraC family transcriptional regulator [Chloroflexota bacterium]
MGTTGVAPRFIARSPKSRPGNDRRSLIDVSLSSEGVSRLGGPRARASASIAHHAAVERVIHAMRQRLDEPLSLPEMAKIALFSPFHFDRIFHRITGSSPLKFLSALRMEAAIRLLLTSQLSVTDICFEVGYNSLGTFSTLFSQAIGISPVTLRRQRAHLEVSTMPYVESLRHHQAVPSSHAPYHP